MKSTRTLDQNAKLHAICRAVSHQLQWAGEWLDEEDWKRLFIAAVYGQKIVPALDGTGFVVLNKRSGRMTIGECSDVIAYIEAWAVDHGVKLPEPEAVYTATCNQTIAWQPDRDKSRFDRDMSPC